MPNAEYSDSQKENKAERTDSEMILPPEEALAVNLYAIESFLKYLYRGETTIQIKELFISEIWEL